MVVPSLPAPRRTGAPYRIALVCLGNICRSPMAHVVLASRIEDAGLADRVHLESFGTGDWHVGRPMDRRAAATLTADGYDATRHRASPIKLQLTGPVTLGLALVEAGAPVDVAFATARTAVAARARALRQYGWERRYVSSVPGGRNSRIDELQAAFLLELLPDLARRNERRAAIWSRYDAALAPQPYLARSWAWSADRRTLTLRLYRGLRWHDGTPTTARDAVFTLDAARDERTGYPRAADLANVAGVRAPAGADAR